MTEETTNELTDTMPINDAVAVDPTPVPVPTGPDAHGWWRGTGRRKTAVARVRIKSGTGEFKVNNRDLDVYFCEARDLKNIRNVLEKTGTLGSVDIFVNANGGGYMGQAGAIILGLGRALLKYDTSLEPILRDNGFLTRDAREVERKKYGQPGARRRFQFSKR
jgi:small subunit ribosomal protein S9